MKVISIFTVQPDEPATASICMLFPIMAELNVIVSVFPMSLVDVSVYTVVVPFHTVQNSPDLAFAPLCNVYLPNADVYDPVA
jgi:hypothetical protein